MPVWKATDIPHRARARLHVYLVRWQPIADMLERRCKAVDSLLSRPEYEFCPS